MTLPYPTLCHHYCSCTISIPIPYPTSAPPHHALTLPYHYLLYPFPTKTLPLSNPTSTVPLPYPVSTTAQYHTIPYPTLSLLYIPLPNPYLNPTSFHTLLHQDSTIYLPVTILVPFSYLHHPYPTQHSKRTCLFSKNDEMTKKLLQFYLTH